MFPYAVIDTFIMTAQNNEITRHRQTVSHRLVESLTVGSGKNHLIVIPLAFQLSDSPIHRLYLHDHTGLSPKWIVVDPPMFIQRVIPKIVNHDFDQLFILGSF